MKVTRRLVESDYGQVHIRCSGTKSDGRPLVCLHQSPKSSLEFVRFMRAAAEDRFVVAIDMPGYGESDRPEFPPSIEDYACSAWQVVDSLGLGKIDLLGNHTGAMIAVEMTYQRKEAVNAIVMVSSLVLSEEELPQYRSAMEPIPLDTKGTRFRHMWERTLAIYDSRMSLEELMESYVDNLRAGEAYEWGHQAVITYATVLAERAATLPHRITVVNPGDMLYELTPRIMPHLQNGQLEDRPEWSLGFMDTDTDVAVELVINALS